MKCMIDMLNTPNGSVYWETMIHAICTFYLFLIKQCILLILFTFLNTLFFKFQFLSPLSMNIRGGVVLCSYRLHDKLIIFD
jgi:hypothetical protein